MDYENLTPQYRIEEYLEAIVSGWVDATMVAYPEVPSWRIEEFLDAFITYIWEDEDHPRNPCPNPVWRLEECLRAIYDVMTGAATPWPFPTPTNRIEEYLAAIHAYLADNTELPVPEPVWRIEHWLAYALDAVKQGGGVTKTVSGTMVHITDALAKAALSVLASIEPIQDLHGYSSPWPAGGGKNLFNKNATDQNAAHALSPSTATEYSAGSYTVTGFIKVKEGAKYITSGTGGANDVCFYDATYTRLSGSSNFNQAQTAPTGAEWVKFDYKTANADTVQLEENNVATSYAPFSNICPISGRTGLSVYRTGVNVWDEQWEVGGINWSTGGNSSENDRIRSKNYIPVVPSTSYYFTPTYNKYMWFFDSDKNVITNISGSNNFKTFQPAEYTFVTPSNCHYIRFLMWTTYGTTYNHDISINYPATDYDYHAYNGNTYAVDWTTEAGTVYGGTVDVVTGVLTVTHESVNIEDLLFSYDSTNKYFKTEIEDRKAGNFTFFGSSALAISPTSIFGQMPNWSFVGGSSNKNVYIKCLDYTDPTAFKNALSGQTIVYELATPLTYQLTAQEVQMLLGENNVWSSSGDTVSVTYYAEGNANPLQSLNILLGGNYSNPKTADDVSDKEALEIILGGNK